MTVTPSKTAAILLVALLMLNRATTACYRNIPLPPVDTPLAPAAPGTWFAPASDPKRVIEDEAVPPKSTGTHITAMFWLHDGTQLIAVWGDPMLWERRGKTWRPAKHLPRLERAMAEVVGLEEDTKTARVIVHTRREGSFRTEDGIWRPLPRPNVPCDANAQALAAYRGVLFVATLNDGIVLRDSKGIWQHVAPPTIGTNAPRQFVVWQKDLYVRHGNGTVDRFDGRTWTKDVFTRLIPHREVAALVTEGDTLLLAQWGGWSETEDGVAFRNHFSADLKNTPLTALLPTENGLLVGTQGHGIAECERETGTVRRWQDERQGIGDDWITALVRPRSGSVIAGTFVSGAFFHSNPVNRWQSVPGTEHDCVTAVAASSEAVFVALRRSGVRRFDANESASTVTLQPEAQCLLVDATNGLLWIGTRTGIATVSLNPAR